MAPLLASPRHVIDHLCREPCLLGAEVGQCLVLHTWKRDLGWHPHVHVIVTAGGWDAQHRCWVAARCYGRERKAFLLPVAVLRAAFQRRLRTLLLHAFAAGDFAGADPGAFPELTNAGTLRRHLDRIAKRPWVIRIEPPFGGPQTLLKYLGAYVNRVAISPSRIVAHDPVARTVTYRWATNAEPDRPQQATIDAVDFLRRFAQHVLPTGFQRIRFRGLWCTAHRRTKLDVVRAAFGVRPPSVPPPLPPPLPPPPDPDPCPHCGVGRYRRIPGPAPRPSAAERRRLLAGLRCARRVIMPEDAARCA